MKRLLIIACLLCATYHITMAQRPITDLLNIHGTLTQDYQSKDNSVLKAGTPTVVQFVTRLKHPAKGDIPYQAIIMANGKQLYMPLVDVEEYFQAEQMNKNQFWQLAQLNLAKHFTQDDNSYLKRVQIQDAENYIDELENANLFYKDEAIEDYLQCILLEIIPEKHAYLKEFPKPLVRVLRSSEPDLIMLGNNVLLVTTGLIATLDTEEELIAMFSREVCHYLLDHSLLMLKKKMFLENRVYFWNSIAEIVAIAADEYLYERYDYYTPGMAFLAKDIASSLINTKVMQQMGMDYSKEQEKEADSYAIRFLENQGYNPQALCSALHKIKDYYLNDKGSGALTRQGKHCTLLDRLKEMGEPQELPLDRKYLKTRMSVITFEATMHDYYKDYENSRKLAMKNIDYSLGTSDDYLMVARSIMKQNNTPESNAECQLYLDKSDLISDTENVNITKMRILLLLRENKQVEATEQLKKYKQLLNIMYQQPSGLEDGKWIRDEHEWAEQLLERIYTL